MGEYVMNFKEIIQSVVFGLSIPAILVCYIIWKFIFFNQYHREPTEFEEEMWLSNNGKTIFAVYYGIIILIILNVLI